MTVFLSCQCTLKIEQSRFSSSLLFHISNFFPFFFHSPHLFVFFILPLLLPLPAQFFPNVPYVLLGTRFKLLFCSCLYTPSLYPVVTFYVAVAFPLLTPMLGFPLLLLLQASHLLFSIVFWCFLANLRSLAVLVWFFFIIMFILPFFFLPPFKRLWKRLTKYEVIDNQRVA